MVVVFDDELVEHFDNLGCFGLVGRFQHFEQLEPFDIEVGLQFDFAGHIQDIDIADFVLLLGENYLLLELLDFEDNLLGFDFDIDLFGNTFIIKKYS